MIQQIMLNTHSQKTNQDDDHAMVGSGAKNPLPTAMHGIRATDMMGLSWIFTDEMFPNETVMAGGK